MRVPRCGAWRYLKSPRASSSPAATLASGLPDDARRAQHGRENGMSSQLVAITPGGRRIATGLTGCAEVSRRLCARENRVFDEIDTGLLSAKQR